MGNTCNPKNIDIENSFNQRGDDLSKTTLRLSKITEIAGKNIDLDLTNTGYPKNMESGANRIILAVGAGIKPKQFIKYYLIYSFYISKLDPSNKSNQKDDLAIQSKEAYENFVQLVKQTHQKQLTSIQMLQGKYSKEQNSLKKMIILMDAYFEENFVRENVNRIPTQFEDPKAIGQLRLPIYNLFNGITAVYREKKYEKKVIYIVAVLNKTEEGILQKLIKNQESFSFSIFMRGFTNEKYAKQKQTSMKGSIMFSVSFNKREKMQKSFDYGYYIYETADEKILKEGDVIFNIMNFFQVNKDSRPNQRQYDLVYGSLANAWYKVHDERNMSKYPQILKVFSICTAASKYYLKTQSCLFRIVDQKTDSIEVSQIILKKKQSNKGSLNQLQKTNIIDNRIDNSEMNEALKELSETDTSPILKAKKIQIYYEMKNFEEVDKLLANIEKEMASIKKGDFSAYQIIQYISARRKMMNKQFSKAKEQLLQLQKEMISKYSLDYEFIGRDVIKSLQECYLKGDQPEYVGIDWKSYIEGLNMRTISKF